MGFAQDIRKALNTVRRGLLDGGVGSSFTVNVKGAGDDAFDTVEFWQSFGLATRPPVKGEVLMVCPMGSGEGAIIVADHDRDQVPSVAANEVVVYGYKSGSVQGAIRMKPTGAINLVPGTSQTIDLGTDGSSTDFVLKGTTFDVANRILVAAIQTFGTAQAVGWTAAGVGFTAVGTAMTVLGSEAALSSPTQNACNTCASAMGTAATACGVAATASTTLATACGVFLGGSYLATTSKVT